ncbi:MAG: hypothetical protein GY716_16355, partial [bacterium]|nr:hypothetical protein [bacterium]
MPHTRSARFYSLESAVQGETILEAVASKLATAPEASARIRATYYDTFDWRVHRDGGTLRETYDDQGKKWLVWCGADDDVRHRIPLAAKPGLISDFEPSPFRDALERVVEIRRLLPVLRLDGRYRELR